MNLRIRLPLIVAGALSFASCGGGGDGSTSPTTTTHMLSSVAITPAGPSLVLGQAVQLSAAPHDETGGAIAAAVTWRSSSQAIASVSAGGVVTGAAVGSATITATATAGGVTVSASAQVVVSQVSQSSPVLTSVVISPAAPSSIPVGSTLQLTASPRDQNDGVITAVVTWTASPGASASVNQAGLVTGISNGTETITATATGAGVTVSNSVTVTVGTGGFPLAEDVAATTSLTFTPATVNIAVSGIVNWTFATTHNVTFDGGVGAPQGIGNTSSGTVSRQFNTAGTFTYTCTLHSGMTGTVVVQ